MSLDALADLVTADDTLTRWPGAQLRVGQDVLAVYADAIADWTEHTIGQPVSRWQRELFKPTRLCGLPVVVDDTFTAGLWRLERDGMTLRAGVVRAEP